MPACQPCKENGKDAVADRIVKNTPMCDHHYRAAVGLPPRISPARMGKPKPPAETLITVKDSVPTEHVRTVNQMPAPAAAPERKETPVEKCVCGKPKGHRARCPGTKNKAQSNGRPAPANGSAQIHNWNGGKGVNYEAVLLDIHQKIEKLRAADAAIRELIEGQL